MKKIIKYVRLSRKAKFNVIR